MLEDKAFVLVAFGGDWEDTWTQNVCLFTKQDLAEAEASNLNADQVVYDQKFMARAKLVSVWMNNNILDVNDSSEEAVTIWLNSLASVEAQANIALDFPVEHKWCHGTRFKVEQLSLVN